MQKLVEIIGNPKPESLTKSSKEPEFSKSEFYEKRCRALNVVEGDIEGDRCDLCKNKGYVAFLKDDCMATRECSCMQARRSKKRMQESGIGDLIKKCTLDSFCAESEWQKDMLRKAMDFTSADKPDGWLYVGGQVGCGKTHICTAVVGEFLKRGKSARYLQWRADATKIKAATNDMALYESLVDPLKSTDVLYVDDLFKTEQDKKPTQADVNLALDILNDRYIRETVTIISGEMTASELLAIDEALGSRILEKSKSHCVSIKKDVRKNYRLKGMI